MTAEEELKELKTFKLQTLKRARVTAAMFGTLAIVALIALVYAFFQQTAANKARIQAEQATFSAQSEIAVLKKQILQEIEKSTACEKSLLELQSSKAKSGK